MCVDILCRVSLTSNFMHFQLHISKLMGGSSMAEGYLWTLSGAELFQIGGHADWVVDLEQHELGVKMLIRGIPEGNFSDLQHFPDC